MPIFHIDSLSSSVPTAPQERVGSSVKSGVSRVVEKQDSVVAHGGSGTDSGAGPANRRESAVGEATKERAQVRWVTSSYADAVKNGLNEDVGESDASVALTTLK
jgi:hypothetical protein